MTNQNRKDELYDQMIAWLCGHISNDEELFLTLNGRFGMTKEELHNHCIESLDKFFKEDAPDETDEVKPEVIRNPIKSNSIKLTSFITEVSDMVNGYDKTAVLNWVAFADSMNEIAGSGTGSLEKELFEVYRPLCYVKNNFSNIVLQQSLKFDTLGNEIIFGAMMFDAGYSYDDVKTLADEGVLEDGFIPYSTTEKSSLSVIGIKNKDDLLFIECYQSADSVRQKLNGAATLANVRGQNIETILTEAAQTNRDIWKITHPKLIDAVKIACTASSAIEHITLYDPENREIVQCNTAGMTTEQMVSLFHSDSVSEQSELTDPILSM